MRSSVRPPHHLWRPGDLEIIPGDLPLYSGRVDGEGIHLRVMCFDPRGELAAAFMTPDEALGLAGQLIALALDLHTDLSDEERLVLRACGSWCAATGVGREV